MDYLSAKTYSKFWFVASFHPQTLRQLKTGYFTMNEQQYRALQVIAIREQMHSQNFML